MNLDFSKKDFFKSYCSQMLDILKTEQLPIIICGDVDNSLYKDFFEENGVIPQNVYDRSPMLHGKKCYFGEIINITDIESLYGEFNAVVVVPYYDEISAVLKASKSKPRHIFYLDIAKLHNHPSMFLDKAYEMLNTHYSMYEEVYNWLSDDISKEVYEKLLNYWLSGDYTLVQEFKGKQKDQYLDFFEFNQNETFLNCGSFDGRYTKRFIDKVGGTYKKIINIECDEKNYEVLCENMKGISNVENIKIGLHNEKAI